MTEAKIETLMEKSDEVEVRVPLAAVLAAFVPEALAHQVRNHKVAVWDDDDEQGPSDNATARTGVLVLRFRDVRRFKLDEGGVYVELPKQPRDGCITTSKAEKLIEEKIETALANKSKGRLL